MKLIWEHVEKNGILLLWIAVLCMFTLVLIPLGIVIFILLSIDIKNKNAYGKTVNEREKKLNDLNITLADNHAFLRRLKSELIAAHKNREVLLAQLTEEAKKRASNEMKEIEEALPKLYAELNETKSNLEKSNKAIANNSNKLIRLQTQAKAIQAMLKRVGDDPDALTSEEEKLITQTDEILSATVELRLHYMDVRQLKSQYTQNKKVINETFKKYESRYTTKAYATLYRLMVLALESELQNVLFNLRFGKLETAIRDIRTISLKYQQISSDGNQVIAPTIAKFIAEIEYLYTEAVKIEYEYYIKKEAIKEEQRTLREQMRQEAEERKRLAQELKKIEQEEEKYKNEMASITEKLSTTTDNALVVALQVRLEELQKQFDNIEHKKEDIVKLQLGKAGYVYVVSNIGSFGESVFKIGMTRRLEPLERISELSGASVPFPFDVHSFIFSDDAVGLENALHKALHTSRLNKVNLRKEFFKSSIDALEEMVYNFQPTAEFTRTMLAEQYNQSISIGDDDIPDEITLFEDDYEDDDDGGGDDEIGQAS